MRVLRFIWRGVLAFDRIGSRIPQLIQIWLIELFFAVPLTFFIAKLIDIRGAFGVPGTPDDLAQHVAREYPMWIKLVKDSGAKVD